MQRMADLMESELSAAGLLLSDALFDDGWRRAHAAGRELLGRLRPEGQPADVYARSLGLTEQGFVRMLAFGAAQTEAIGRGLGLDGEPLVRAVETGAIFNLGICAFDHVCDEHPGAAERLARVVNSATLPNVMHDAALMRTGDPRVDPLLHLIITIFGRCRRPGRAAWERFEALVLDMNDAELAARRATRAEVAPSAELLSILERKSVLPIEAVALICLIEHGSDALEAARAHRRFGEVLWLADDLADLARDWQSGRWSRPWALWAQHTASRGEGLDVRQALDAFWASPVPRAEVAALVAAVEATRELPGGGPETQLDLCIRTTVQSWLLGITSTE